MDKEISWNIFKRLTYLSVNRISGPLIMTKFADILNLRMTDSIFKKLKDELLNFEVIKIIPDDINPPRKNVIINLKNLNTYIEESMNWEVFSNYVHKNKLIYDNI
jgi:hypothetical protein